RINVVTTIGAGGVRLFVALRTVIRRLLLCGVATVEESVSLYFAVLAVKKILVAVLLQVTVPATVRTLWLLASTVKGLLLDRTAAFEDACLRLGNFLAHLFEASTGS